MTIPEPYPEAGLAPPPRGRVRRLLEDLGASLVGGLLALVLLWYLHDEWQVGWALLCGLGGAVTRRWVRPSYASFPAYVRRPLSLGVLTLGTIFAVWATLAREPASYWLLRWREAVTLPVLGGIMGLGLASVIYTTRRLEREIEAKQRLEDDLQVASRIQRSLLRASWPSSAWVEGHAVNIASRQVGGDYYEIIDAGEQGICFAVGDVSGKGVPAALLMSSLQSAFLAAYSVHQSLDGVCDHVNRFLVDRTTPERYATFFVGKLTPDGTLEYVNAGHNPPLLLGNSVNDRLFGGGMPLGLFAETSYTLHTRKVDPESILLVYTDGVTEAADTSEEEFGEDRLANVVTSHRGGSPADISAAVLEAIRSHTGTVADQADDITLLVLRPRAGGA